tara:strand:- start:4820 stop:5719 length:900 start_codon:yes stop_codon:yes gene_type:complete
MDKHINKLNVLVALMLTTSFVSAEMRPIDDEELSEYVGQAAVAFDVDQIGTSSYTRVTLGMEADLQMNINNVELGNYAKAGETLAADFAATNLAFGSISTNSAQVQLDGQTYAANDIVPFELNDPFFEIAQNASEELIGFRLGFGEARGQLSGDFTSMSGNIGADITDFFGDDYRASLLDVNGNADNSRAQYFGVDGAEVGGATNCSSGFYCYNLADYKTLDVGQRNTTTNQIDYTNDFFISFQKESTEWSTSEGLVNAGMGVFINIPTSLQIDMNTGINAAGTDRVRVEYIDRGNDLF